ncbi:Charged multivesicular body protein 2a like protein [Sesbania bispinosa]|nr:Charged multivesicular body protein 2a like protein [Sesbania bispinosa]
MEHRKFLGVSEEQRDRERKIESSLGIHREKVMTKEKKKKKKKREYCYTIRYIDYNVRAQLWTVGLMIGTLDSVEWKSDGMVRELKF